MEKEKIIEKLTELGAYKTGAAAVKDIAFDRRFREMCESNACGNYGRCYMCPPYAGDIDELIEKARSFHTAIIYQTVNELEDSYDFEGMMAAGQQTNDIAQALNAWLKENGVSEYLHLGAGGCRACEKCAKIDNLPCRHPEQAMASLETYGVNVSELAKQSGMKYINGKDTVTFFGGIFFK